MTLSHSKILIRCDVSVALGTGHFQRCLTLALKLNLKKNNIVFVCRQTDAKFINKINSTNFLVKFLPQNGRQDELCDAELTKSLFENEAFDWIIVDHYSLGVIWENSMREIGKNIMVIDDLANRKHNCDLLLDQNYYTHARARYESLVPFTCDLLLGPNFSLLRDEFIEFKKNLKPHDGNIKRVLVFFGGSDEVGETLKLLDAIENIEGVIFEIVIGAGNPAAKAIQKKCLASPEKTRFHCEINYFAKLMLDCDLAIGAGGATTWERCYLGLPSLTVVVADNQLETTLEIARLNAIIYLGTYEKITPQTYEEKIKYLINNPSTVIAMSQNSLNLFSEHSLSVIDWIN